MGILSRIVFLYIVLHSALSTSPVKLVGQCSNALRSIQIGVSDTARKTFESLYLLDQRLDQITWDVATERTGSTTRIVLHSDVSAIAPALRVTIEGDTTLMRQVGEILARQMRGEAGGSSWGQAVVASDLYREWRLPAAPLMMYVVDPQESMRVRALAVYALENHWQSLEYKQGALAALCSVAARAEGVLKLGEMDSKTSINKLLNDDEVDFLESLTESLEGKLSTTEWRSLGFGTLPTNNPVSSYVSSLLYSRKP